MRAKSAGILALIAITGAICAGGQAAAQAADPLAEFGAHVIRSIDYDLYLPAGSYEYETLGKHAVIRLTANSAIAPKLPLRAVFVEIGDVRVPLQRIKRFDVT